LNVGVFGSSLAAAESPEYEMAREIGRRLARGGAAVVCGGYGGAMEAASRGAAEAGGESIGVVLVGRGAPNAWVTRTIAASDLSDRLRRLRDLADAWIFLPRGLGTLLELVWLCESIVKEETAPRPLVLLGDFWRPTVELALAEASRPEGRRALVAAVRYAGGPEDAVSLALKPDRGQPIVDS